MGDSDKETPNFELETAILMKHYERILASADQLYDEELEVLAEVAEALLRGQEDYGQLDLTNDPRNFKWEALDEDRDWLAYRAMQIVQDRKRGRGHRD